MYFLHTLLESTKYFQRRSKLLSEQCHEILVIDSGGETYKRKLFDFVEQGHFIQLRGGHRC